MVYRGLGLRVIVLAERRRHQSTDKKMPALSKLTEADTQITFIICERGQEPSVVMFEGFDPSHIRDKVFTLIALDGAPFLIRQIWYLIYGNHHPL